jgi:predicted ATPase/transcriptional regulator with XRE-family HTH domain
MFAHAGTEQVHQTSDRKVSMASPHYKERKHDIGRRLLALRDRTRLTQTGLASLVGVNRRSIQNWEAGDTYPQGNHLERLIAVVLERGGFTPGREREEAEALWEQVSQDAPRPLPTFDAAWFDQLVAPRPARARGAPRATARDAAPSQASVFPPAPDHGWVQRERKAAFSLPFQATPLIGRSAELTQVAWLLADPACRLLTLLGPGGIGKTRLALEAAAGQTDAFGDGVAFVPLASVRSPNQIASAIGDALCLSFAGQPNPTAHLLDYLRERRMLLLLDDFEHLLEGAALISSMLEAAPHLSLLVTSRARLNLQAEWLFDVEGLSYPPGDWPDPGASRSLADVTEYGAVQLFVQRATQVQPEFPLQEATLTTIAQICQHVAGMPLAIELAAAGVRYLPISEIERQIRSNLDVLATSLRDVPLRHRSMRAAFDQSWNLLSEPERALFSRLAVFRGGCTAAAAEQVAGSTLPLLAALLDKSLVRQDRAEPWSGDERTAVEPRFVLLEPIREYALEQLAAQGEVEALQRAHAGYYLALAEAVEAGWDGPAADATIELLDHESDNLRAALQWARDGGDHTLGLQLAAALWRFWRRRGALSEARAWLEELLALDEGTLDPAGLAARLRAMKGAAWLASYQHDFAQAAQLFEQSMALRRALGGTEGETSLLDNAARAWRSAGQYRQATPLMQEALAQHRALGDRGSLGAGGLGFSLYELGLVLREQGDFAAAAALFEECVEFHRSLEDREGLSIGLLGLSDVARDQGDIAHMRQYCEESLAILREMGVQWAIGFALNNLALAAYLEGDLANAFALISESVSLYRAQQAEGSLAEVLVTLGHVLRAQGDVAGAHAALTEALRLALAIGPRLFVAAALEGLASLAVQPGQSALATRLLSAASALRDRMSTPVRPADQPAVERTLATARAALGPDAFARVWEAAQALPPEQILSTLPDAASLAAGRPPLKETTNNLFWSINK